MIDPDFAKEIVIIRRDDNFIFEIDGKEFPWAVTDASFTMSENRVPSLTITIPADKIIAQDEIRAER